MAQMIVQNITNIFFPVILNLLYEKLQETVFKFRTSFSRRWRCCHTLIQAKALLPINDQSQNGLPQRLWKFPFGNENFVVIDSTDNGFFGAIAHSSSLNKAPALPTSLLIWPSLLSLLNLQTANEHKYSCILLIHSIPFISLSLFIQGLFSECLRLFQALFQTLRRQKLMRSAYSNNRYCFLTLTFQSTTLLPRGRSCDHFASVFFYFIFTFFFLKWKTSVQVLGNWLSKCKHDNSCPHDDPQNPRGHTALNPVLVGTKTIQPEWQTADSGETLSQRGKKGEQLRKTLVSIHSIHT